MPEVVIKFNTDNAANAHIEVDGLVISSAISAVSLALSVETTKPSFRLYLPELEVGQKHGSTPEIAAMISKLREANIL